MVRETRWEDRERNPLKFLISINTVRRDVWGHVEGWVCLGLGFDVVSDFLELGPVKKV